MEEDTSKQQTSSTTTDKLATEKNGEDKSSTKKEREDMSKQQTSTTTTITTATADMSPTTRKGEDMSSTKSRGEPISREEQTSLTSAGALPGELIRDNNFLFGLSTGEETAGATPRVGNDAEPLTVLTSPADMIVDFDDELTRRTSPTDMIMGSDDEPLTIWISEPDMIVDFDDEPLTGRPSEADMIVGAAPPPMMEATSEVKESTYGQYVLAKLRTNRGQTSSGEVLWRFAKEEAICRVCSKAFDGNSNALLLRCKCPDTLLHEHCKATKCFNCDKTFSESAVTLELEKPEPSTKSVPKWKRLFL